MDINNIKGKFISIKSQIIYIDDSGKLYIIPNIINNDIHIIDDNYYGVIIKINACLSYFEYFIYVSSNNKNIIGLITNTGSVYIVKLIWDYDNIKINIDIEIYNDTIYTDLSCFKDGVILLKEDGNIEVTNLKGRYRKIHIPKLKDGEKYVSVVCGYSHIVLLKNDNTVVAYGWNKFGQCDIPPLNNIDIYYTQICAHPFNNITVLLRNDGKCICIGQNKTNYINKHFDNNNKFITINNKFIFLIKNDGYIYSSGYFNRSESYNHFQLYYIKTDCIYFIGYKNQIRLINKNFEYNNEEIVYSEYSEIERYINFIKYNKIKCNNYIINIVKKEDNIYLYNIAGDEIFNEDISSLSIYEIYYKFYLNINNILIPILMFEDRILKNHIFSNFNIYRKLKDIILNELNY